MRLASVLLMLTLSPVAAIAQSVSTTETPMEPQDRWRATITIFRSPGTGLQMAKGHFAGFVGFYPTVISRDGEYRNTNFVRVGAAYYVAPNARTSPYASLSIAPSLSKGWGTSGIADVGLRRNFSERYSGQLGVAVLYAPQSQATRVNPTIGFGVRF